MGAFIDKLDTLDRGLMHIEKTMLCLSLTVMLVLASLQVLLRNVFHSGIESGDLIIRHLVLFLLFFGASLSTREHRHLQMDIASKIIPKKGKRAIDALIILACIGVNALLLVAAYDFVRDTRESGDMLFDHIPTWTFMAIMPVGFALITFRFLINFVRKIVGAATPCLDNALPIVPDHHL